MSHKSSLLTNEALDRLFGYNKTNKYPVGGSNDPNVFLQQIPSSGTSSLNALFGNDTTMSPVQSSDLPLSEQTIEPHAQSFHQSNVEPIQTFHNSSASSALPATLEDLLQSNRNPVLDQVTSNKYETDLTAIRLEEQQKQAELNKLRAEEERLSNLYQGNAHTVYHIVIDSACSLNLSAIKPYTHGNMRSLNKQAGRIPVTLSLQDAESIAQKIATEIDNRGASSTNAYPIFGTIILEIKLDNVQSHFADVYRGGAKRDYGLLNEHMNDDKPLVIYNAGGVNRGMLHPNAMATAKLSAIKYQVAFRNVDEHVGFAMFNMLKLNHRDIQEMKKAYKSGQLHTINDKITTGAPQQYVPQEQPVSLTGGSQLDYKQLYLEEKALYQQLKQIKANRK